MNPHRASPVASQTGHFLRLTPERALVALVILAAAVRVWGIQFGLPLVLARPDEQLISGKVIEFFQKGTLNPRFFDYPTFYFYVLAALYGGYFAIGWIAGWFDSIAQFVASWPVDWVPFFMIGRFVGALTGTASVWLLYDTARRMFDRRVALLAAFFLSLAFLHVRDSHYGTTDVPMTALLLASMLFIVRTHQSGQLRDAVLAGAFAGLAMATKYNAVMLVAPMVLSGAIKIWDARGRRWQAAREARLHWMLPVMGLAFFAGSPYVLLDYGKFLYDMKWLRWSMDRGMTPPELLGIGWVYHLRVSLRYGLGLPLLTAGLAGIALLLVRRPREASIWCAFPFLFYAVAGDSYNVFVRYMVPVVPFLCLTAAFLTSELGDLLTRALSRRLPVRTSFVLTVLAGTLIWPSAASVVAFDRLLARTDSRLVAGAWMREHAPAGSVIFYAGNLYGHLQLEERRPFKYVYWKWDRDASKFRNEQDRWTDEWPEFIVVHESPLPYSHVPPLVEQRLRVDYALAHVERAVDGTDPRNVYDLQDGFFLPYAGFQDVQRPGPNIHIYRRRR